MALKFILKAVKSKTYLKRNPFRDVEDKQRKAPRTKGKMYEIVTLREVVTETKVRS